MGLFDGTPLERPVTCAACGKTLAECRCPRDAGGDVRLPQEQTGTVRREKRARGKVVTTVRGLDPVASDLPGLLKRLRSECGAGGTVREGVIEVQGDHGERVAALLRGLSYDVRLMR